MLRLLIDENFSHPVLRGIKRRLPSLDYVLAGTLAYKEQPMSNCFCGPRNLTV